LHSCCDPLPLYSGTITALHQSFGSILYPLFNFHIPF
jgi:hypothetical protein